MGHLLIRLLSHIDHDSLHSLWVYKEAMGRQRTWDWEDPECLVE
jgi:hypothetical protein